MSHPIRTLAALLIVAVAAAAGYWLYASSGSGTGLRPVPVPTSGGDRGAAPDEHGNEHGNEPRDEPPVARTEDTPGPPSPPPDRRSVARDPSNAGAAQGIKGRVLLPGGEPAADVPLYLVENMINDPIRVFLLNRSGRPAQPVSSGRTAADGTFALGAPRAGESYDLRVVSERHPELIHQSVKAGAGDWYDTGDLELTPGATVVGRVVDGATKAGIPGAAVYLTGSNHVHTLLPTPGRERGILAVTDGTGAFRFDNATPDAMVNLAAEAPGYASTTLVNQRFDRRRRGGNGNAGFVLELASGHPIAGVVVDSNGEPLADVRVTAKGLSQKTPQTANTSTGDDGRFAFPTLRDGPYELVAETTAFAETRSPPIMTGEVDVKLVLAERPWVKLRVESAKGRPLKAYRISLKRHFPGNELGIGNVPNFRDRTVTPADYPAEFGGEWAVVRGLPHGEFVFQISERDHAKTLSQPFVVRPDRETPEVGVTLTLGATITGTVIDEQGKPVRGATVSTDMNNAFAGSGGFLDFLKQMIPERHSQAQARTDAQGRFRLPRLAFASYMVRVSHPDYCEGESFDITLSQEGQVHDAGVIQLSRGTVITGYTMIEGRAAGQVKVSVMSPQRTEGAPHADQRTLEAARAFAATAISGNDGRYRVLARVPPGEYRVHAMRASGSSNPFEALFDIKATEKTITVVPGRDLMQLDFNLTTR